MKRALIVGANGQLAQAIIKAAPSETECIGLTREDLDVRDAQAVQHAVETHAPEVVFNGAAYNLVDKAESEGVEDAFGINAVAVAYLAAACREIGVPLVHFSTDYVFDGRKTTPYEEDDAARPLGVYAASKLAGENVALAASPRNFAVRVSRLFGPTESDGAGSSKKPSGNFPLLMLRLGRERDSLRVVNDQIGSPSYTPDLACGAWQLVKSGNGGLYQLSNAGEVAFDEYAREIMRLGGVQCAVEGISTEEYGAASARPLYSTLSNEKAHSVGVVPLRHWRDALREFIEEVES